MTAISWTRSLRPFSKWAATAKSGAPWAAIPTGCFCAKWTKSLLRKKEVKPAQPREKHGDRPQKLKFTFKEQREYDTIDEDIANLESAVADCEAAIEVSASDYVRLQELLAEKESLEKQLEEKTERWIYLNDLAERIEAQNAK